MTTTALPNGFHMRAPTPDDLDELAALLIARERARTGKATWQTAAAREWIASVWATSGFEVARDARVVITPSGEIAGYITVWRAEETSGRLVASPRILPRYEALSLDVALLRWAESLARQKVAALPSTPSTAAAVLTSWVDGPDPAAESMLTREGFTLTQRYLRMEVTLQEPTPAPEWPAGVVARAFTAGHDERAVYDLMNVAFGDTPNYTPLPFEEWRRELIDAEGSDPSLWTLATQDGQLIGAVINRVITGDEGALGWLEDVGVRPAWRRRGLGLAMLYHSFGLFYQRGIRRCGLSVDAHNASGATRLYARAGMTAAIQQEIRFTKPLNERA